MSTSSREPIQPKAKQPKRPVVGAWRPAGDLHFDLILSDTDCFGRALREYRETSWDDSSFEELSFEAQQTILGRAQEIKSCQHRLRAVLGVQHPIAS